MASISHTAIERGPLIKGRKRAPFSPRHDDSLPLMRASVQETLQSESSCIQVPHVDFHGDSATCNRGFQGNCRHLLLHTTSSARANHHPRDETTEPKNANAETGQHLFFFFPCSDTTAALHFFCQKARDAPFFECKICKMLGKHLPRSPLSCMQETLRNRRRHGSIGI